LRNAVLHAIGANAIHRLRRSNADKRKAVEMMLADDEWSVLPNTEIPRSAASAVRWLIQSEAPSSRKWMIRAR